MGGRFNRPSVRFAVVLAIVMGMNMMALAPAQAAASDGVNAITSTTLDNAAALSRSDLVGNELECQYAPLAAAGAPQQQLPQGINVLARDEAAAQASCERVSGASLPFSFTTKITFEAYTGSPRSWKAVPYPDGPCVTNSILGQAAIGLPCTHQVLYDLNDATLSAYHRAKFEFFTSLPNEPRLTVYSAPWYQGTSRDLPAAQ